MTESNHIDAVRDLAQTVTKLGAVDAPELDVTEQMIVDDPSGSYIDVRAADEWWSAWCDVYEIATDHAPEHDTNSTMQPDVDRHRQYESVTVQTNWTSLRVRVYADGDVHLLAEYDRGNSASWDVLFEGRLSNTTPDPVELGRAVASAELATLVNATGSDADALDYWQTELVPEPFRQTQWANVRGVGRQTVNDRVRGAKDTLN